VKLDGRNREFLLRELIKRNRMKVLKIRIEDEIVKMEIQIMK
jgi:poly(3-hydroxyalkanoate) synthetase